MSSTALPHRLGSLLQIAESPWFDLSDGRLKLTADIGPIIDIHTHLSHSFVLKPKLDLLADSGATRHYLPLDSPHDLDVYANQNLTAVQRSEMTRDLTLHSVTGHGMCQTHTVPNLLREMGELGIRYSVMLPIDLPGLSRNAERYLEAARTSDHLIPFGCVHPSYRNQQGRLDAQIESGAQGMKLHPGMMVMRPDHPRMLMLAGHCGARHLPMLFHCGPVGIEPASSAERCQVRLYERPIQDHPDTTFILGHSGALQYDEAIELAQKYENVYLDLSCVSLPVMTRIFELADPQRILYGSDWPFYHQALPLVKVLLATEGREELRRNVLYDNAARLLDLPAA